MLISAEPILKSDDSMEALICTYRDIGQRRRTEEALRESEQKYSELVRQAPAAIYEIDFQKKRLLSVNDAMRLMTSYSRDELLSINPFDLLDEKSQTLFEERINRWLQGEKPDQNVEYRGKTKGGGEIDVVMNVTFMVDESGKHEAQKSRGSSSGE